MTQPSLHSRLDALLDRTHAGKHIHSAVLKIESGNGGFCWAGARGEVSPGGAPMTPETPWFAASITKLFIAAVVMRMVEEGELGLDDRLLDRLPSRVTNGLHVLKDEDRTDQIALEHLLSHTSGLPDFIEDYPAKRRAAGGGDRRNLVEILLEEGDRSWSLEDTAERVRTELQPHFPPQPTGNGPSRVRYSDTNFQPPRSWIST